MKIKILIVVIVIILFSFVTYSFVSDSYNAPKDRISEQDIIIERERFCVNINNPVLARITEEGSMSPTFDNGHHTIYVKPKTPEDLQVGDIIDYNKGGEQILHRIIKIKKKNGKSIFITKGDYSSLSDTEKLSFKDINYIVVGVLY